MKSKLIAYSKTINWRLVGTFGMFALIFVVAAMLPALAQAGGTGGTDTSQPMCKALSLLAPKQTRIVVAAFAIVGAIFGMWQEQQNPMTWAKKHIGTMSFCVFLIGAPTIFTNLFQSTCAGSFT